MPQDLLKNFTAAPEKRRLNRIVLLHSREERLVCFQALLRASVLAHNDEGASDPPSIGEVVVRVPQHFQTGTVGGILLSLQ